MLERGRDGRGDVLVLVVEDMVWAELWEQSEKVGEGGREVGRLKERLKVELVGEGAGSLGLVELCMMIVSNWFGGLEVDGEI